MCSSTSRRGPRCSWWLTPNLCTPPKTASAGTCDGARAARRRTRHEARGAWAGLTGRRRGRRCGRRRGRRCVRAAPRRACAARRRRRAGAGRRPPASAELSAAGRRKTHDPAGRSRPQMSAEAGYGCWGPRGCWRSPVRVGWRHASRFSPRRQIVLDLQRHEWAGSATSKTPPGMAGAARAELYGVHPGVGAIRCDLGDPRPRT